MKKQVSLITVLFVLAPLCSWAFGSEGTHPRIYQNPETVHTGNAKIDFVKGKLSQTNVLSDEEQAETLQTLADEKLLEEQIIEGIKSYKIQGGNSGGGGGDDVGLEFQKTMILAVENFKRLMPEEYETLKEYRLEDLAMSSKVIVVDEALAVKMKNHFQDSVAVNFPTANAIILNRSRVQALLNQRSQNALSGIALHEILSLRQLESTGYYPYSSKFVALLGAQPVVSGQFLNANRGTHLPAEESQASRFEFLKRNFVQARQPVNLDVIEEFTKEKYTCSWISKIEGASEESEPQSGSIFYQKLDLNSKKYKNTRFGPLQESYSENLGKSLPAFVGIGKTRHYRVDSSVQVSSSQYVVRSGTTTYEEDIERLTTIRKNSGFLVFNWIENATQRSSKNQKITQAYGYCFPKK